MRKFNFNDFIFIIFCLLPLIGNQPNYKLHIIAKTLNIIAYAYISYKLIKIDKRFSYLVLIALGVKILHFKFYYDFLENMFLASGAVLIAFFSAINYVKDPQRYRKLFKWYLIVSLPFVILQSLGLVKLFHRWNTLFLECVDANNCTFYGSIVNMFGQNFLSLNAYSAQYRPPGLLHSNANLAPMVSIGICFFMFIDKKKFTLSLLVCVALAVFSMSKILQMQLVMIAILFVYFYGSLALRKSSLLLVTWLFFLAIYNLMVPGIVENLLNYDTYIWSSFSRLLDFYSKIMHSSHEVVIQEKETIRQITGVGVLIVKPSERGSISGIGQLKYLLPFFAFIFYVARKVYLEKVDSCKEWLDLYLPWSLFVSLIIIFCTQYFVTPLWGTHFIVYFQGLLFVPIIIKEKTILKKINELF